MSKTVEIPPELAGRAKFVKDELVERMKAKRAAVRKEMGDTPYGAEPATPEEKKMRFGQLRNNPVEFLALIQKIYKRNKDGQIVLPKQFMADVRRMEAELRKGAKL